MDPDPCIVNLTLQPKISILKKKSQFDDLRNTRLDQHLQEKKQTDDIIERDDNDDDEVAIHDDEENERNDKLADIWDLAIHHGDL